MKAQRIGRGSIARRTKTLESSGRNSFNKSKLFFQSSSLKCLKSIIFGIFILDEINYV